MEGLFVIVALLVVFGPLIGMTILFTSHNELKQRLARVENKLDELEARDRTPSIPVQPATKTKQPERKDVSTY